MTQMSGAPSGGAAPGPSGGGLPPFGLLPLEERPAEVPGKDDQTLGMLSHLAAFAGVLCPFGNIIGPLVVWLMKKDKSAFVETTAKESLNFQISMLIWFVAISIPAIPLLFVCKAGALLWAALAIFDVVMVIIAALKANEGIIYRYPLCLRLVK